MHRLHKLPFTFPVKNLNTYQALTEANFSLGKLQGIVELIPNIDIILKLISIDEAKSSSEIEDITSSHSDYFRDSITRLQSVSSSENLINCMRGMRIAYFDLNKQKQIDLKLLHLVQRIIEPENIGIRTLPGLKIYNKLHSRIIHVPPQNPNAINEYLDNLIEYITNNLDNYDPLIKMAIIHFQFECIHPYLDGNGRVGRVLNTLYLVQENKLKYPLLNLSTYLCNTQKEYFDLLKKCHNDIKHIEEFILYILKGVESTASYTINQILIINKTIEEVNQRMRDVLPDIHSYSLTLHLFKFMYTKNELLRTDLAISRATSTKYLKLLVRHGFLESEKIGKEVLYKNTSLSKIFTTKKEHSLQ